MRVLMIHTFHHARGGDTTYTRALTSLLEAAGHEVIPLAMRHPDNDPSVWEARFPPWISPREAHSPAAGLRLARQMIWSPRAARAVRDLIRDARPDVAHIQHVHRHLTPSVLDPLNAAGIPVVWTVHDYELICPSGHLFTQGAPCERCRGGDYTNAVRHRCKWDARLPSAIAALEKSVHRLKRVWWRVDRFLCPSRFLADKLIDFGLPADRIQVLPNPLELEDHPLGEGPGEGWLYAGRLAAEKGVDVAIEAARALPGHRLTICGDGPESESLRRRAADLPWVHFTGFLPPDVLAQKVRAARVVVVPSRWYENFPYAVLEAQAAGRAVVASRIGGIPEQITDGTDGRLVAPDDPEALRSAVAALLSAPEKAAALGAAGRARIRTALRPDQHVETVVGVYRSLFLSDDVRGGR
ncbi:MAG: glycosyltransferase involved in cell wall biosynthesis [Myxococcota bacterium]|jgi:glycosyltransferase involved in cell wall biosynthesis